MTFFFFFPPSLWFASTQKGQKAIARRPNGGWRVVTVRDHVVLPIHCEKHTACSRQCRARRNALMYTAHWKDAVNGQTKIGAFCPTLGNIKPDVPYVWGLMNKEGIPILRWGDIRLEPPLFLGPYTLSVSHCKGWFLYTQTTNSVTIILSPLLWLAASSLLNVHHYIKRWHHAHNTPLRLLYTLRRIPFWDRPPFFFMYQSKKFTMCF